MYIEESSINGTLQYRLEWSSDPIGPVIVFVNPLLTNIHLWDPVVLPLKKAFPNSRFLRCELPRQNNDSAGDGRKLNLDVLCEDIADLLEDLEIPKVHAVIGVGLGGTIALAFASRYPNLLDCFVACNFHVAVTEKAEPTWDSANRYSQIEPGKKHGMNGIEADKIVASWLPAHHRGSPLWQQVREMVASAPLESLEAGGFLYDESDSLRNIGVPALFISGSQGGSVPGEMAAYLEGEDRLGGCTVIEGAGHLPMLECPETFVGVIEPFLRGIPALGFSFNTGASCP